MYADDIADSWLLAWEHGRADVQALGGMLGPVTFRLSPQRELDVMHVAPWSGMTAADALPGVLRRLRGEWPCVPFGRTDEPRDLPPGWHTRAAEDGWSHGYAANHRWHLVKAGAHHVHLAIDYPDDAAVARIERTIAVDPQAPALDITLTIHARRPAQLPTGLHPTFRLPPSPGRVQVQLGTYDGIHSYPTNAPGAISRLRPDSASRHLGEMAGVDGPVDLSRLPLPDPSEELLQVRRLRGTGRTAPFSLRYLDYGATVSMWWDSDQLPDLMLWISNGGRIHFPWMSRHLAIGAEPINSLFDLGRVAHPPPQHPLADRLGLMLDPSRPTQLRYRIAASLTHFTNDS